MCIIICFIVETLENKKFDIDSLLACDSFIWLGFRQKSDISKHDLLAKFINHIIIIYLLNDKAWQVSTFEVVLHTIYVIKIIFI